MKKFKVIISILLILPLIGCANDSKKMNDEDLEKYGNLAQEAITLINQRKTEEFINLTDKDLNFTQEMMEESYKYLDESGDFVKFIDTKGVYQKDKESGETHYTIFEKVKYENNDVIFTINCDKNLKIIGFFFR